jgi:DNA-binding Lrp family transcriptional regulator
MLDQGPRLKQFASPPVTWLSEGRLKLSLLLRYEAAKTNRIQDALKYLTQEKFSAARVYSEFPRIHEPDGELVLNASNDYLRCILAKSIDEVYRKITPRYRNEAARKQFFKKLVEISELTHLAQSSEKLGELISTPPSDETTIWVRTEFDRLLAAKVNLATEHSAKLGNSRLEFRSILKQLEKIIGFTWEESERFQLGPSLASFYSPGVVESEGTWRWGCQWDASRGVLNVNPPMLFFDILRRGILAREAAILLTPRIMDSMELAPRLLCEQAEYLADKLFERKNDRMLWAQARHGLRTQTRYRGDDLIDFFQYYEMLVGESLYHELWSRLREFGTARLTVADYYIIFNSLAARPATPKFTVEDVKLLDLLSKRPDVRVGDAARLIKVSIPTAMKAIRDLSRRAGLRFTIIVDMQKIGLLENLVFIKSNKQSDVLRILSRFPYCRQVFRTYGSFDLFSVLDIPSGHEGFVREFMNGIVAKNLARSFTLLQLDRDLQAVNFGRYDVSRGRWDIHWDTWGINLRENLNNSDSRSLSETNQAYFQFDKLDMKIMMNMHTDCRIPFSTLGRSLGVSGAYVGKKVAKLLREHVFRSAIWPLKIGSEDWGLIVLSCSRHVASTLALALSDLPAWRGGLVTGDFEGLVALVWAPTGELKQLFKAIDDRVIRAGHGQAECLDSIGEWIVARWLPVDPIPHSELCTDDGKWLFDEQRYMSSIQQNT